MPPDNCNSSDECNKIFPWQATLAEEKLTADDFNLWCAFNDRPFRLARYVWPDGLTEWDVEAFPGAASQTVAYGTGQQREELAAMAAFAFVAGVEWGEQFSSLAGNEETDADATEPMHGSLDEEEKQGKEEKEGTDESGPVVADNENTTANEATAVEMKDGIEALVAAGPASDRLDPGTLEMPPFELPPLALLQEPLDRKDRAPDEIQLAANARALETVLRNFRVRGEIMDVRVGPVVTLYELEPVPGTKSSTVINLADDIARSMRAITARIAVVPGRSVIGIELPNDLRETVYLREILASPAYQESTAVLPLALGKDISGTPVVVDLARMPHLLIAGTTGSGKSVGINTMILSLLYRLPPTRCRLVMVDPKMLELSVYDGIPHLLTPVVTDSRKAVMALKWTVREMESRYRAMAALGVRNIESYNMRLHEIIASGETLPLPSVVPAIVRPEDGVRLPELLPYVVVVVDEMADLMLVAGRDIEAAIQRLAQMARAAGIHLIMATQRPSVDVITGTIKANFPSRISFQVTSKIDSRTILGDAGAEQLVGQGDMLAMSVGGRVMRVHGPFVADAEVESVVRFLKVQGQPHYLETITTEEEEERITAVPEDSESSGDGLYDQAVALVVREQKISVSFIQRQLQIGYNRSARMVERMENEGIISSANHVGKREILVRRGNTER
ncbi:MAG: DNA segregation ATPase FtsK/SpoIIIE S-DNA-T family [Rhodospirillaceae bacterium]|nr:MAG: DNA segregation ATPase FtsK/SpoIIIE S-DNA-T family [Rhodospirillaceae bacterium]